MAGIIIAHELDMIYIFLPRITPRIFHRGCHSLCIYYSIERTRPEHVVSKMV
jgi:hypothetical protein